jgi:peptide methionine sulfoxide reductase MsrB
MGAFKSKPGGRASESNGDGSKLPIMCEESVMRPKGHGTTSDPVQKNLRWAVDVKEADKICCFNRHYAERSGSWLKTQFLKEHNGDEEVTFYDSVTGKPLFVAPRGRSWKAFVDESRAHGWPSFRDQEVIWDDVRCLANGEAVSLAGTHLGHNLPDRSGNRYCINLCSVAGVAK